MHFTEIRVMKRKNLGNYEHKEVGVTLALGEKDCENNAYLRADKFLDQALSDNMPSTVEEAPAEKKEEKKAPAKKKAAKKAAKKVTKKKEEAPVVEITFDDIQSKMREVAKFYKSAEKVKALMSEITGKASLKDMDQEDFQKLMKKAEEILSE